MTSLFTGLGARVAIASKKPIPGEGLFCTLSAIDIFWNQTLVCDKTVHLWQEKLLIWSGCQIWFISWIMSSQSLYLWNIPRVTFPEHIFWIIPLSSIFILKNISKMVFLEYIPWIKSPFSMTKWINITCSNLNWGCLGWGPRGVLGGPKLS